MQDERLASPLHILILLSGRWHFDSEFVNDDGVDRSCVSVTALEMVDTRFIYILGSR